MYTFSEFISDLQAVIAQVEAESEPLFDDCENIAEVVSFDSDFTSVWEDR